MMVLSSNGASGRPDGVGRSGKAVADGFIGIDGRWGEVERRQGRLVETGKRPGRHKANAASGLGRGQRTGNFKADQCSRKPRLGGLGRQSVQQLAAAHRKDEIGGKRRAFRGLCHGLEKYGIAAIERRGIGNGMTEDRMLGNNVEQFAGHESGKAIGRCRR